MSLHTYDNLEQGSEEWLAARRGMVTASTVGQLLEVTNVGADEFECPKCLAQPGDPCKSIAKGRAGAPITTMHGERSAVAVQSGATRVKAARNDYSKRLTLLLVSERIMGVSDYREQYVNNDMMSGQLDEPIARDYYAEHISGGEIVSTVGFLVRDDWGFRFGASPDAFVGDEGGLEIKCPRAKEHLRTILADEVPPQYMAQIQGCLLASGRKWWDFMSYFGGLKPYVKRVYPDPRWAEAIVDAVAAFEQTAEEMTHNYDLATRGLPATEPRIDLSTLYQDVI